MFMRIWSFAVWLQSTLGTVAFTVLIALALYILYVAKMHAGIDIFPGAGLHLPGPRTLVKMIARLLAP
jgi:hypothetical protein